MAGSIETNSFEAPFELELEHTGSADTRLCCERVVRRLPGRRWVCAGRWRGEAVYAKIYAGGPGRRHWRQERRGLEALAARGLPAPRVVYAGRAARKNVFVLLTRALERAVSFRQAWETAAHEAARLELADRLLRAAGRMHGAGLLHRGLRLEDFLLQDETLYTVDGAGVVVRKGALPAAAAVDNLGLLLAQFCPEQDALLMRAYPAYIEARGWADREADRKRLQRARDRGREQRKRNYLQTIFRECSAFGCIRSRRAFVVYDRAHASAELEQLLREPDTLLARSDPFLKQCANSATVGVVRLGARRFVVKRYNTKHLWHRLVRALRTTRAARSWRNAHLLRFYGIPTVRPLALLERRLGPLRRQSYFISEYVEGTRAWDYFLSEDVPEAERAQSAKRLLVQLHRLARFRIGHGDMKAHNFIIMPGGMPVLLDLDAMKQYRSGFWYRTARRKDIERFLRNWEGNPQVRKLFAELNSL